jgi:uncharacterized protein (TIGR03086 family)
VTGPDPAASRPVCGLLERAIGYALGEVAAITPDLLSRPTPCQGWDLGMLLSHAAESLAALQEGIAVGHVRRVPSAGDGDPAAGPVAEFCERARQLGTARGPQGVVGVGDRWITLDVLAATGALEIAVHGWDVSRASGDRRPIPPDLATELLSIAPLLVSATSRPELFAPPVTVPATACPSDRLAAFLGRAPGV